MLVILPNGCLEVDFARNEIKNSFGLIVRRKIGKGIYEKKVFIFKFKAKEHAFHWLKFFLDNPEREKSIISKEFLFIGLRGISHQLKKNTFFRIFKHILSKNIFEQKRKFFIHLRNLFEEESED